LEVVARKDDDDVRERALRGRGGQGRKANTWRNGERLFTY
jgi:hypothetical protein